MLSSARRFANDLASDDGETVHLEEGGPSSEDELPPKASASSRAGASLSSVGAGGLDGGGVGVGASGAAAAAAVAALAAGVAEEEADDTGASIVPLALWLSCACGLVLFNKHLFETSFPFPLTLTALHLVFASLVSGALQLCGALAVPRLGWGGWACSVVPLSVLYAASLGGGAVAAARLSVSFLQMLKATLPSVGLVVSVAGGGSCGVRPALVALLALGGVALSAAGEELWDGAGVAAQGVSVLAEALRLAAMPRLAARLPPATSPLVSLAMLAPPAAAILAAAAALQEPEAASRAAGAGAVEAAALRDLWSASAARWTTPAQLLASCAGYLALNAAVVHLVRRTSGATISLAGVAKDALLIVASIAAFGSPVAPLQVAGYALALVAINALDALNKAERDAPVRAILTAAVTNRRALLICVAVAMIFGVSTSRALRWEDDLN